MQYKVTLRDVRKAEIEAETPEEALQLAVNKVGSGPFEAKGWNIKEVEE
jgi:hypothetical protein